MRSEPFDTPPDDELHRALAEFVRAHRAEKLPVPTDGIFILPTVAVPAGAGQSPRGVNRIQLQSCVKGRWVVAGYLELLPDGTIIVSDTPDAIRVIKNERGLFNAELNRVVTPVETALYFETLVKFGSGRTWRAVDQDGSDALPEEPRSAGRGPDCWRADSRRW